MSLHQYYFKSRPPVSSNPSEPPVSPDPLHCFKVRPGPLFWPGPGLEKSTGIGIKQGRGLRLGPGLIKPGLPNRDLLAINFNNSI